MDGATNFYKVCLFPKRTLYHKLVYSNANQLFFVQKIKDVFYKFSKKNFKFSLFKTLAIIKYINTVSVDLNTFLPIVYIYRDCTYLSWFILARLFS